jgi:hypothetical protein
LAVVVHDPRDRSPYRSPDAVLAEAQRIAADIRRRAEREANAIRREAAEWASSTRHEADRYRERVLAELEHARAVAQPVEPELVGPEPVAAEAAAADPAPAERAEVPVIDLRTPTEIRPVRLVIVPPADDDDEVDDDEVVEAHHRPAVGGTYVVGHRLPPPGTSIETKVHDVVRLAVRRTFHRRFP